MKAEDFGASEYEGRGGFDWRLGEGWMGLERDLVWRRPVCFWFLLRGLYDGTHAKSG